MNVRGHAAAPEACDSPNRVEGAFVCPQCDLKVELGFAPTPVTNVFGQVVQPHVIATKCERCVAWIRLEGWSSWSATHYSMTPFREADQALKAFPEGVWLAVADAELGD